MRRGRTMRRDARARREALLIAAADCFSRSGLTVPLDRIADQAGVGRATLYRNFKDRMALVLAIFDREVDAMESSLDPSMPLEQALRLLVRQGAGASTLYSRIAADIPASSENAAAFAALGERITGFLRPVVAKAQEEGKLRRDVGPEGLLKALRMINGVLKPHMNDAEMDAEIGIALALLFDGLRPRAEEAGA